MKKSILFMVINMNVGGTERALLNMIAEMPEEEYDITLLMLEEYGGFLNQIPSRVKINYLTVYPEMKKIINDAPKAVLLEKIKKGAWLKAFSLLFVYLQSKMTDNRRSLYEYILKDTSPLNGEYDIAIAYAGPMDFISYFIAKKVKAKKKLQWIHFDITKIGFNKNFASEVYQSFDKIHSVSHEGKEKLINRLPCLEEKIETYLNVVSPKNIMKAAQTEGFTDDFKGIRILTIGRLSKEKGQDLIIPVMAQLKTEGFNVKWYCIGGGPAKQEYEELISDYGVEEQFILLGSKANPYPFLKECDIYVQPSRHEGYCISLAEARVFQKPIVCTDFTGAKEQVINEKTGLIVSKTEKNIYEAVKRLVVNSQLREKLSQNMANKNATKY